MSTIITNYYEIPDGDVTSANDYIVDAGGEMYVLDGGAITNSVVKNGGALWLDGGGTGDNISATLDGELWLYGEATELTADSGGYIYIDVGGSAKDVQILDGGRCVVYADADADEFTINAGGSMLLYGGSADLTHILEKGTLVVQYSTAKALNTDIDSGGLMRLVEGGTAQDTEVHGGGKLEVLVGEATGTVISGGSVHVAENNTILNTTIEGGALTLSASLADGVMLNDGKLTAEYSSVDNIVINGGSAEFTGSIISGIEIGNGGAATMDSDSILFGIAVFAEGASFAINGGSVVLDATLLNPTEAQIQGFSAVTGIAIYTLTTDYVADGTYQLVSDAASFGSNIEFGHALLSLEDNTPVVAGNQFYSISLTDNNDLTLTVSTADISFFSGSFDGNNPMLGRKVNSTIRIFDGAGSVWSELEPGDGWDILGTGDFNSDAKDDILRINESGLVMCDFSTGDGTFTEQVLNAKADGWDIFGTGDFNGDGKDDVLVGNPTAASESLGMMGYWDGGTDWTFLSVYYGSEQGGQVQWEMIATGDFGNADTGSEAITDGKSDMLWINTFVKDEVTYTSICTWITGAEDYWHLVSATRADEWSILGVGDFNGDSSDDIAMINSDGLVGICGIVGGEMASWSILSVADSSTWMFAGIDDFNNDGTDDIAWCSRDNLAGYWQINDNQLTGWQNIAWLA